MSDKIPFGVLDGRLNACPEPQSHWRHYKGGEYVVVGAAICEADQQPWVVYRPVERLTVFCRPLQEWHEKFTPRD